MSKENRTKVVDELRESLDKIALSENYNKLWDSWEEVHDQLEADAKANFSLYIFKQTEELYNDFDKSLNEAMRSLDQIRELIDRGRA